MFGPPSENETVCVHAFMHVCVCMRPCLLYILYLIVCSLLMKQLAFQLGRQQVYLDLDGEELEDQEDLIEIMANAHLNANFLALGREVR